MSEDMKESGGTGSSLLQARLQRMRQGPMVTRSRPQQQAAPSFPGRMSLGGGAGAGALGSILERSKERASMGPWNPFAENRPAGFGASSGIFRNTESSTVSSTSTLGKKYTPVAPPFESRQASSDLLRVREMLKERGYASVPVEDQQPQTSSFSSRRESLLKRQPAVATSYSSFGGVMEETPGAVPQERFFSRPSFVSSLSTNGHVNGAAQVERESLFSRQRSPLVSPTLPISPTFSPSPTFPTSVTHSASPSFPISPVGSHVEESDVPDFPLSNKRQEIESQFEALGGTMDSQTAGALDRISRARKFLEESKRASEARLSVSTKDKYQISKKFLENDKADTSKALDNGQIASPTDSIQSPAIENFSSQFVSPVSPVESSYQDSTVIGTNSLPQSVGVSRFSNRYEEPNENSARDIFPPRYVPLKQDVNHSETSLFRPIEANRISQRLQNLRGSTEEEPYTFKREEHTEQSSTPISHTLPRTKASQKNVSSNSKESAEPKAPRAAGYDRPTKSTAAKAMPETKPKPTKNPVKKTSKKLPQIAMFENMGQQNKPEEKPIKKGSRGKNVEPSREKTVQKMLFGRTASISGDQADGSDVVSEDGRSLDSAELVSISQRHGDFGASKDGDKGSKSGTSSPRSKTPRPNRASPHSRLGRSGPSDKSSRSSSSDKSGQFSPGSRRKSVAESPSKSRSRRNSPERPRRKSISEQRSSTPLVRRNSIRATDGLRVEDKGTVSSRNKMVDKARSRSKPDLRDISVSRDEKSPSKPAFRRSKSVGKQENYDGFYRSQTKFPKKS
ncbi:nucleolar and coiled-body phosphoprotein 1-like [Liolophura sinensis]|uniref:nucleolar and coiled-body phosphoprotein 1-like n=1 Tax=Liolophura sinensis TaxID=3198878 RepID=UPI0031593B3D